MKKITLILVALTATIIIILSCTKGERNNPFDPNSTNYQGVIINSNPQSATITEGQTASFSVTVQGANVQYQWQKDSNNIPNTNSTTLIISGADISQSGSYRCIVWNGWESDTSAAAILKVNSIYTITYDGNGNTGGSVPLSQTKTQGIQLTLSVNTENLVKTGYIFSGWNTSPDGSGTDYVPGASYATDADVTLYAKWTPTYTITYDGNGNTGGSVPLSQTKTQGIQLTLSGFPNLIKTGYIFSGWNTAPDGSGTNYAIGTSYTTDADLKLYAKWTPAYTITFDGNGNTGGSVPLYQTKIQGLALTLSGNTGNLVKTGYAFAGWNTSPDGTGINYALGASYTTEANIVLYAKWTALPIYIITYFGNGNTSGNVPLSQTKTQGIPLTLSGNTGNLVKTGYTFSGWNTSPDGSGTNYAFGASYTTEANLVLYAKWTKTYWMVNGNTLTDPDGNTYTYVTIGTQVWTVENLKTTKYNDGSSIPYVSDSSQWANLSKSVQTVSKPGYCWYSNNISYKATYGALYNWYVVNTGKLAPIGWHVPTDADWMALSTYLGRDSVAGGKMKETGISHWQSPNTGATNSSGFSALPGGDRNIYGHYSDQGYTGFWWSATEYDASNACGWFLMCNFGTLSRNNGYGFGKKCGFSVRLVRD